MGESVDFYCERVGPGLWAEPVNAFTNAAFLIAAWGAWRLGRRDGVDWGKAWPLIAALAAIGAGSFAFHLTATRWALWLDVVPIAVFQWLFVWRYARDAIGWRWPASAGLLGAFLLTGPAVRHLPFALPSAGYWPALLFLTGLGIHRAIRPSPRRATLLAAAGLFAVSLAFRSVDHAVCDAVPIGTHFLWHLLNASVLYLALKGLFPSLRGQASPRADRPARERGA